MTLRLESEQSHCLNLDLQPNSLLLSILPRFES